MHVRDLRLCDDRLVHRARERHQRLIADRGSEPGPGAGLEGVDNELCAASGKFDSTCFDVEELRLDQVSCLFDPIIL